MLLGLAAVGGAAGAYLGMLLFRHKTRKQLFRYGVPVIFIVQLVFIFMKSQQIVSLRRQIVMDTNDNVKTMNIVVTSNKPKVERIKLKITSDKPKVKKIKLNLISHESKVETMSIVTTSGGEQTKNQK